MAEKFARQRMAQICIDDANYKPTTVLHIKSLFLFCFLLRRGFDTAENWMGLFLPSEWLRSQETWNNLFFSVEVFIWTEP